MTAERRRDLRAVLRNALTWGVAWGIAGGGLAALFHLFDPDPAIESLPERVGLALFAAVSWGVRFAFIGGVIGTVFATLIRLNYRGRRLADISPLRFALLGAVVGGVGVPLFLQAANVLTGGHMIAWGLVTDDAVWATVFGAAAAGGSILLARRADALSPSAGTDPDRLEGAGDPDALPAAGARDPSRAERSRSTPG
jgi:MFS family permease